jgi:Ger(x)C family germination protein
MKKGIAWISLFSMLLFLPGCWDQDDLKEARLVILYGLDRASEGKIKQTVAIREVEAGEQQKIVDEIHSAVGLTERDSVNQLRKKTAGRIRHYDDLVYLFGKSLATSDIYPLLDVLYRDPKTAVYAKMAIVDGKAQDIFRIKKTGTFFVGQYLFEVLKNAEDISIISSPNTVESTCSKMLDPGKDFMIPLVKKTGEREVQVTGAAMFHGHRMTGRLHHDQAVLFTLLSGRYGKEARFARKVHPGNPDNPANYILIQIGGVNRKFKVATQPDGKVDVHLHAKLRATVMEYPRNELENEKKIKKLNKTLSNMLTRESKEVIQKMQRARCDAFGVGRQLIAFHPEVWKRKKWSQDYPKVRFHTKVEVEITGDGLLK